MHDRNRMSANRFCGYRNVRERSKGPHRFFRWQVLWHFIFAAYLSHSAFTTNLC
ncbi:hypothetical protein FocTR4_00013242 [Fusarium oxysporum f. sp. cubense]|uniref:Uncharacterized protein n=2 Tax=Fusarium oxysporum species complex TaxID=171631 RepID=A0A5C6SKE7_FUSOC|nr:hypothetical protein FocTR4_00013242 [Fusarium oxysporum f. sp. cubense]